MKLFLFITIIFTQYTYALEIGECLANPDSKKYFDTDFHAPYPKLISFTCRYKCMGERGEVDILGTSKIESFSTNDDAKKIVCDGVKVKNAPWGFEFDKVEPIYSHSSRVREIKEWANLNIDHNNKFEYDLLIKLKETLVAVANSYQIAGQNPQYAYFKEAGDELLSIAQALPDDTRELDHAIKKYLIDSNSDLRNGSKEGLLYGVLSGNTYFRQD